MREALPFLALPLPFTPETDDAFACGAAAHHSPCSKYRPSSSMMALITPCCLCLWCCCRFHPVIVTATYDASQIYVAQYSPERSWLASGLELLPPGNVLFSGEFYPSPAREWYPFWALPNQYLLKGQPDETYEGSEPSNETILHQVDSYDCHYDRLALPAISVALYDADPLFALRVYPPGGIVVGEAARIRNARYFVYLDGVPDTDLVIRVVLESNQIVTDIELITINVSNFFEFREVNVRAFDDYIDENKTDYVTIRHEILECAQSGDAGVCQLNHTLEPMVVTVLDDDEARVNVNYPPFASRCTYCGPQEDDRVEDELPQYHWLQPWEECYTMFHNIVCGRHCSPSRQIYTLDAQDYAGMPDTGCSNSTGNGTNGTNGTNGSSNDSNGSSDNCLNSSSTDSSSWAELDALNARRVNSTATVHICQHHLDLLFETCSIVYYWPLEKHVSVAFNTSLQFVEAMHFDYQTTTFLVASEEAPCYGNPELVESEPTNYSIALNSQPGNNASVHLNVSFGEGVVGSPASLVFTADAWNISQNISVRAVDDSVDEISVEQTEVNHTVWESEDVKYAAITGGHALDMIVIDNDKAGVQLTNRTAVMNEGDIETRAYAVWLWSEPTQDVIVTITATEYQGLVAVPEPPELTFSPTNWAEPYWVELTIVDDRIWKHSHSIEIRHETSSADPLYDRQLNSTTYDHLYSNVYIYEVFPDSNAVQSFGPPRRFSYSGTIYDDYVVDVSLNDNDVSGYNFVPLPTPSCFYYFDFTGRDHHMISDAFGAAADISVTMKLKVSGPTNRWRNILHVGHEPPSTRYNSRDLPPDTPAFPALWLRPSDMRFLLAYGGRDGSSILVEEAVANVVLDKPATASSVYGTYSPANAVDGTMSYIINAYRWLSDVGDGPHWIAVDLQGLFFVQRLRYWTGYQGFNAALDSWALERSLGGDVWEQVYAAGPGNTDPEVDVSFVKTLARHVRLYVHVGRPKIYEMEVYGQPADTSTWAPEMEYFHLAYVKVGTSVSVYINGDADITYNLAAANASLANPLLYFGADYWNDGANGLIHSACIHQTGLSASDVADMYIEEMAHPVLTMTSTLQTCAAESSSNLESIAAAPFISEYMVGRWATYALEIFNPTCNDISLAELEILIIKLNGGWESASRLATGLGSIGPGQAYLMCSWRVLVLDFAEISGNITAECDYTIPGDGFDLANGMRAVGLSFRGVVIDAIGAAGERPAQPYNVSGVAFATKEHSLVRKPHVFFGSMDWSTADRNESEWIVNPSETVSTLGTHDIRNLSCPVHETLHQSPLRECDAFSGASCCGASEDLNVSSQMDAIESVTFPMLDVRHPLYPRTEDASVECAAQIQYLKCGLPCSPIQARFSTNQSANGTNVSVADNFRSTAPWNPGSSSVEGSFRMCNSFCSRLQQTCGSSFPGEAGTRERICESMAGDQPITFGDVDCFGGGLWISEDAAYNTSYYSVSLTSEPIHPVTFAIVPQLLDMGTTLGLKSCLSVEPTQILFGADNWSVPFKVTVTVVQNFVDQGFFTNCAIDHTVNSSDPNYVVPLGELQRVVEVTVADDDVAGVTVTNIHDPTCVNNHHGSCLSRRQYTMALSELRRGDRSDDSRRFSTAWRDTWSGGMVYDGFNTSHLSNSTANGTNGTNGTYYDVLDFNVSTIVCQPIDSFLNGLLGRMVDSNKTTYAGRSLDECAKLCLSEDDCLSFEHADLASECSLSRGRMGVDGVNIVDLDFMYHERLFPGCINITARCGDYAISLNTQPSADVTVVSHTDGQVLTEPLSRTIRTSDWLTPVQFTVCVVDDFTDRGLHSSVINHTVHSDDHYYNDIMIANITIDITDDDYAGVTSYCGRWCCIEPAEGGSPANFLISLATQPERDVNISILTNRVERPLWWANSSVGEGVSSAPYILFRGREHMAAAAVNATNANWVNATDAASVVAYFNWTDSQDITVVAIDDSAAEGDHYTHLTIVVQSDDPKYNLAFVPDCYVRVFDNDQSNVTVQPETLILDEGGNASNVSLRLASQPVHEVTINISIQIDVLPQLSRQMELGVEELRFNYLNWNTTQTVSVAALEDYTMECSGVYNSTIHLQMTSDDPNYSMLRLEEEVYDGMEPTGVDRSDSAWQYAGTNNSAVVTINNDAAELVLDWAGLNGTAESFFSTYFEVKLSSQPVLPVQVQLTVDNQLVASLLPISFDAADWNTSQRLDVFANDDFVDEDYHVGVLSLLSSSSSVCFHALFVEHVEEIEDNDCAGMAVTSELLAAERSRAWNQTLSFEAGSPVTEALSETDQASISSFLTSGAFDGDEISDNTTYTVSLLSQPLANVSVEMDSVGVCRRCTAGGQLIIAPPRLDFTPENWNVKQEVLVVAVDDSVVESEADSMTYPISVNLRTHSPDPKYNSSFLADAAPKCFGIDDGTVNVSAANCSAPNNATARQIINALLNEANGTWGGTEIECTSIGANYINHVLPRECAVHADGSRCAIDGGDCRYRAALQRDFCKANDQIGNLTLSPMPVLPSLASLPPSVNVSITLHMVDNDCPRVRVHSHTLTIEEGGHILSYNLSFETEPRGDAVIGILPRNQPDTETGGVGDLSHVQTITIQNYTNVSIANWTELLPLHIVAIDDWRDENIHFAEVAYFLAVGTQDVVCTGQELQVRYPILWDEELQTFVAVAAAGLSQESAMTLDESAVEEEEAAAIEAVSSAYQYNPAEASCPGDYLLLTITPTLGLFTYPTALVWRLVQPTGESSPCCQYGLCVHFTEFTHAAMQPTDANDAGQFVIIAETGSSVGWVDASLSNAVYTARVCR